MSDDLPPDDVSEDMFTSSSKKPLSKPVIAKPKTQGFAAAFGKAKSSASAPDKGFAAHFGKSKPKPASQPQAAPKPAADPEWETKMMEKLGFASFGKKDAKQMELDEMAANPNMALTKTTVRYEADSLDGNTGVSTEYEDNPSVLPVAYSIPLRGHDKVCGAMTLDCTGTRLVTAGWDHMIRMWDFAGMTSSFKFFREFDPMGEFHGAYTFNEVEWSPGGDVFVMCRAHPQPYLYSREGVEIVEFAKGDVYVAEMKYTKGHTGEVTACEFSPNEPSTIMTGGKDSTVRLWDVERCQYRCKTIIKTAAGMARHARAPVSCASYTPKGDLILAGCEDGNIYMWPDVGPYIKPSITIKGAHQANQTMCSVKGNPSDANQIVSRGLDETLKIWDIRKTTQPLKVFRGLETTYDNTDVVYSPTGNFICTGTSAKRNSENKGQLIFYDSKTLTQEAAVDVAPCSAIRLIWHKELNQILVGCSDGVCRVFYDPKVSKKGALLCVNKHKRVDEGDVAVEETLGVDVRTPHQMPMYREMTNAGLRKRERNVFVPDKSGMPKNKGPENTMLHFQMKSTLTKADDIRNQDPVEALHKYAKDAEEQPLYVTPVYKDTQPKPIFSEIAPDEDPNHPVFGGDRSAKRQKLLEDVKKSGTNRKVI